MQSCSMGNGSEKASSLMVSRMLVTFLDRPEVTYSSMFSKMRCLISLSSSTGPSSVYSVPLTHFSGHCSRKARPNWTSSIFLPLYQSGHKGLREMFFFIGWFSFRKVKWWVSP